MSTCPPSPGLPANAMACRRKMFGWFFSLAITSPARCQQGGMHTAYSGWARANASRMPAIFQAKSLSAGQGPGIRV
eukprot:1158826-Pelagomonas_calceolata.AAC.8